MQALRANRRRRTKIVATLGPATDDPLVLEELIRAGVDVCASTSRTAPATTQAERIERVRSIAAKVGRYVGIIGDLQGPKIRIESFRDGCQSSSRSGQPFTLDTAMDPAAGDEHAVGVAYREPRRATCAAATSCCSTTGRSCSTSRKSSGTRSSAASSSAAAARESQRPQQAGRRPVGAGADRQGPRATSRRPAKLGLDFVAVSFVRNAEDVKEARRLLRAAGGDGYIVAKIERAEAVREHRRDHRGQRRDHGRARRSRRRGRVRGDDGSAEGV